jgi:hypothetical protein
MKHFEHLDCIDPLEYFTIDEIKEMGDFDTLTDELYNKGAFDKEIVYYSNAIKFLYENDPSLRNSLEIASEMGFDTQSLNSEILASLLLSEMEKSEWYSNKDEINDIIYTL